MNIVMVGPFPADAAHIQGGVQASVFGLAKALQAQGETVTGISLPIKAEARQALRVQTLEGLRVTYLNAPLGFLASTVLHVPRALRAVAQVEKPVVHVHGTGLFQCALLACLRVRRIACVWTLHGITAKETWQRYLEKPTLSRRLRHYFYRGLERLSLNVAHKVIVDTPYVAQAVAYPAAIIPQGIFLSECSPLAALPRTRNLILSVGVFDPRKGHHLALESFASVKAQLPDATLVIAGSLSNPEYYERLCEQVLKLGLSDAVRLHVNPARGDIMEWLGQARLFALHSQEESQGIALCEALAAGVPVAATRVGGIPYVVTEGKDGLLCDYGDVNGFAAQITRLLADPALHDALASHAAIAARRFDWQVIAGAITDIYRQVAHG